MKGLDSRTISIATQTQTFFNLPDMCRWYIRHLPCYIFWNHHWIEIARDVTKFITLYWQYCVLKSLLVCLATYWERVRLMCFTCWLRSSFSHFMNIDSLIHRFIYRTLVVYKFLCTSCNACYVGETSRHFSTWVREHLFSDRSSNIFRHLQSSESCWTSCTPDCFQILDSAATKYQVKLKQSMFIKWEKPVLNQQVKHINLTLSL